MPGRVLVGMGVVLAALPVVALSAMSSGVVAIQPPPAVVQAASPPVQLVVQPSRQQSKQLKIEVVRAAHALRVEVVPQVQEPQQEPEPWRSTKKATDPDVVAPEAIVPVHPKYTAEAMRQKIQGMAAVEVIVSPEGEVSAARITKSLDREFGLDEEALKAAWQWRFLPGTHQGQRVAMRVMIDLAFRLH